MADTPAVNTTDNGGSYLKYVFYIVIALFIVYVIYLIYMIIKRKIEGRSVISTYPDPIFKLDTDQSKSGQTTFTYNAPESKFYGNNYTFSTKIRIYDIYSNSNSVRPILLITNEDIPTAITEAELQSKKQNPGIYLDTIRNNLKIVITTNNGGALVPEQIIIDNVPVRKTFTLTITVKDRQVTVYMDDKMARAQVLSYMPVTLPIGTKLQGGIQPFNGEYANPRIWDTILSLNHIRQIVSEDPKFINEYLASTVNTKN